MGTIYTVDGIRYETNGTNTVKVIPPASGKYSGSIVIPSTIRPTGVEADLTVTEIGDYTIEGTLTSAFESCTELVSVVIPNTVTKICSYAFWGSSITAVTIGSGVTTYGEENESYTIFLGCTSLSSVTLVDGLTSIPKMLFDGCTALTSITIPNSVTSIGQQAFDDSGLTAVTIPDSVTSFGSGVFIDCDSLTTATLGSGITTPNGTFASCSALTSVTFRGVVTELGSSMFSNCTSLSSFTIPSTVTTISDQAFYQCTSLTSMTIPSGVTSIKYQAFMGDTALTSMTFESTTPPTLGSEVFNGCINLTTLYVPSASVSAYKTAWPSYASKIKATPVNYEHITYNSNKIQVDSAIRDGSGQKIDTHYIKGISASGTTITVTKGSGTTSTETINPQIQSISVDSTAQTITSYNVNFGTTGSYNASTNPLTTKEFVNTSIETSTATFRGTFNSVSDLELTSSTFQDNSSIATALGTKIATADKNDYSFVQVPDAFSTPTVIKEVRKFKHNGTAWVYEYTLNNSGFTSAQWNAINSGITSSEATKLGKITFTDVYLED